MAGENEGGFDVEGGAVRFGLGDMRSVGQGGPFGQVQGAGFGVRAHVKRLRGRAGGVGEGGRAVAREAGWRGRAGGHGFGGGSGGAHTQRCSGVEVGVREGAGTARGGGGRGRRGVRRGRSLLLWGGIDVTGVRPIGGIV